MTKCNSCPMRYGIAMADYCRYFAGNDRAALVLIVAIELGRSAFARSHHRTALDAVPMAH
ncbi:hypothetical protein SAMN04487955_1208 [Halomonas korlensis]|uniref:Uncharacterized protein n=1 Tax=Halomonas korlensis TaxID=463301 RepID=A0A1I7KGN5_9GAMM|nr:hypothetical protein SAMN04487955_1208 [Halomonas korlensis]